MLCQARRLCAAAWVAATCRHIRVRRVLLLSCRRPAVFGGRGDGHVICLRHRCVARVRDSELSALLIHEFCPGLATQPRCCGCELCCAFGRRSSRTSCSACPTLRHEASPTAPWIPRLPSPVTPPVTGRLETTPNWVCT